MTTTSPPCVPSADRTASAARVDSLPGSLYPASVSCPNTPAPQTPAPRTAAIATASTGHRKRAIHEPQAANTAILSVVALWAQSHPGLGSGQRESTIGVSAPGSAGRPVRYPEFRINQEKPADERP